MTALQLKKSEAVERVIEEAASLACKALDSQFPGADAGGITSNFHGHLVEVITRMLKGQSVLDGALGYATHLPRLVIDAEFFGCPLIRGEMFLIHKPETPTSTDECALVFDQDTGKFKPISTVGNAFTSFKAAAEAAMAYLEAESMSLEQANELKLEVVPVVFVPGSTSDRGFKIVRPRLTA